MRICRSSISSTSPTPIPRGLSAIDVCETHKQGRRPVYVPDGGLVYDVFSIDGPRSQLRQILLQLERGDLLAVLIPFLMLVAQEVFERMLAEHIRHEVGLLHDLQSLVK